MIRFIPFRANSVKTDFFEGDFRKACSRQPYSAKSVLVLLLINPLQVRFLLLPEKRETFLCDIAFYEESIYNKMEWR